MGVSSLPRLAGAEVASNQEDALRGHKRRPPCLGGRQQSSLGDCGLAKPGLCCAWPWGGPVTKPVPPAPPARWKGPVVPVAVPCPSLTPPVWLLHRPLGVDRIWCFPSLLPP